MIGAGVRVEGNISFTGVLRIQGDVLGDVSCDADINGTVVVGQSGNVTGTISVPHIVVGGRVSGPANSSGSIEIRPGASLVGDAFYSVIEVHAGGAIEGLLIPRGLMDREQLEQERFIQVSEPSAAKEPDMPLANAAPVGSNYRVWYARKLGWAVTLLIAVVAVMLASRDPAPITPIVTGDALRASSSMNEPSAAQSASAASGGLQDGSRGVAENAVPLAPSPDAATTSVAQASPSDHPEMDPEKVVVVQGVNPGKPAGVVSVISKEPSVLFRKKRQDSSEGTRIFISKGATTTISIAKNEIVRVAEGRNLMIFYQGRRVAPKTIESGAWMSFVPLSP